MSAYVLPMIRHLCREWLLPVAAIAVWVTVAIVGAAALCLAWTAG